MTGNIENFHSDERPLVSIGMPIYNKPERLREVLEHLFAQTYKKMEILISDNASENPEVEIICREFEKKYANLTYIRQKTNYGPFLNFQTVLKSARGKYFKWQADDDLIDSNFMEECVSFLEQNEDYVIACGEPRSASGDLVGDKRADFTQKSPISRVLATYTATSSRLISIYGVIRTDALKQMVWAPSLMTYGGDRQCLAVLAYLGKIAMLSSTTMFRYPGMSNVSYAPSFKLFYDRFIFAGNAMRTTLQQPVYRDMNFFYRLAFSILCALSVLYDSLTLFFLRPLIKKIFGKGKKVKKMLLRQLKKIIKPFEQQINKHDAELDYWRGLVAELTQGCKDESEKRKCLFDICHEITYPRYKNDLYLNPNSFSGQKILDLGCGPHGGIIGFENCEKYGVDALIDSYKTLGYPLDEHPIKYFNARSEALPFENCFFDCVICVNALDHVDDLNQTLREIARVVKIGGKFIGQHNFHEKPRVCEPHCLKHDDLISFLCKHGFECERVVFQCESLQDDRYYYSFEKKSDVSENP
ncbi:MAG: hypothetical protein CVV64_13065 [Candidatus Wallbacteria bacterium HGW-Wallbacteria-1]|jgi:glycosyltransferase domain-containing protein|uniref:Glycosyltransferase 2-like domain-containing protein n=1 Tax=Candidatus Wallbacteria bacterium HGW-Wallbacteria-1 TaxID=2013854 RepID=A0A2N1PN20_9BACT|nr:MAG: hypothetical protein CVV64_13065 [Candidatus Wallbacteria bacterium HGW-Wallbacteria-1]